MDEGVELVVVEIICKIGAVEASADEVAVVGVDSGLGWAGIAADTKNGEIT